MSDQATVLRGMMERRPAPGRVSAPSASPRARTIALASGKGGVGKSVVTLNLGVALAMQGARVCLIDANLGLGSLDLLCGLNGYWNLSHVMTGARHLSDVLLSGPAGIHLAAGASGLVEMADSALLTQPDFMRQLEQLENEHDFLLIDTGAGIHRGIREFLIASQSVMIVTTPEPTALADAYATIKSLALAEEHSVEVLVNMAGSAEQAANIQERLRETASRFVRTRVTSAGFIPRDATVPKSVAQRSPFVLEDPQSPASRAIHSLARRLRRPPANMEAPRPFFPRLCSRLAGASTLRSAS